MVPTRHLLSLGFLLFLSFTLCSVVAQDTTPPASVVFNFDNAKAILSGDEFRRQLADLLDVPLSDVIIVRYTAVTATVVLCAGDVAGLVRDVEQQNARISGTLLEGADVMLVVYGVPCQGGPAPLPPPPVDDQTTAYTSQTSDFGRTSVITNSFQFDPTQTSFDFPIQTLPPWQRSSYVPGETAGDASSLSFSFVVLGLISLLAWAF